MMRLRMILPKGKIYRVKRTGPSTDPCGTTEVQFL